MKTVQKVKEVMKEEIISGNDTFQLSQEYGVASSLMITAGFILVLYGSVEKFKEGYRESLAEEHNK